MQLELGYEDPSFPISLSAFVPLSQLLPSPFQYLGPGWGASPFTSSLALPTGAVLHPQKSGLGKIRQHLPGHRFGCLSLPLVLRPILIAAGSPGVPDPCSGPETIEAGRSLPGPPQLGSQWVLGIGQESRDSVGAGLSSKPG